MDILDSIKYLRTQLEIPQENMIENMSASTYSRIENGQRQLKFDTLKLICDKLGITVNELLEFSETDTDDQKFAILLNQALQFPKRTLVKNELLKDFFPKQHISKMETTDLAKYCSIKCLLGSIWKEISPLTDDEIHYLYHYFINKQFYVQKDYQIAMNSIVFFSTEQISEIIKRMYPVKFYEKRTQKTKGYATHIITNAITSCIYRLEYKAALYYIELAESTMDFSTNYYLRLNIQYHKNIALRFVKRDTVYIEKARQIIGIMYEISDKQTAEQFEDELNKIINKADYYFDTNNFPRTTIKE